MKFTRAKPRASHDKLLKQAFILLTHESSDQDCVKWIKSYYATKGELIKETEEFFSNDEEPVIGDTRDFAGGLYEILYYSCLDCRDDVTKYRLFLGKVGV